MSVPGVSLRTVYRRVGEFAVQTVGGETVVVPIRSGVGQLDSIFTLNEVGARIWSLLQSGASAEGIATSVCNEYEVTPEEALRDVAEFLASLAGAGIIQAETGR